MRWCRLCNFVLKGHLPTSLSSSFKQLLQVGGGVQGEMCLRLVERASSLGCWQAGAAGTCVLSWSHTPDLQKNKTNKKVQALTFLGLAFLICQSKTVHKVKGLSHRGLGLGSGPLNPLPTSARQCLCLLEHQLLQSPNPKRSGTSDPLNPAFPRS